MSRSKRFLSGLTLGYAYQGLVMLVGIWLTPFLLNHIGQHDFGVWLVGSQLVGYLALLDVGILGLAPREVAYVTGRATGEERAQELSRLLGQLGAILVFQTLAVAFAAAMIWVFRPASWQPFSGPIAIILMTFTVLFPCRLFQAALDGLQDLAFIGRVQIAVWATSTVLTALLVLSGVGLYALAIGWAYSQLALSGTFGFRLWFAYRDSMPHRFPRVPRSVLFYYLKRGFWITFSQITGPLMSSLDVLIISKLYGVIMVVPYSCTMKLTTVLTNQPGLLMQVAGPGLSELKAGGNRGHISRAITALTQAMLILSGLIGCIIVAVNQSFVSWWVGPGRFVGLTVTVLGVANMMLRHWNTTATYSIFCFGYERYISITMAVDGCLTSALCFVLAKMIGMPGIPLGALLTVLCWSLPRNLAVLRKETATSLMGLVAPLWPWFWRFVLIFGAAFAINLRGQLLGFSGIAAICVLCSVCYGGLMLRPGLASALGTYLAPRMQAIGKRMPWANAEVQ